MTILTTGVLSGLGRYIYENLGGIGFTRNTTLEEIRNKNIDIIIHCAFNSRRAIDSNSLYQYFNDNVFLTKELVSFPSNKFIFISTIDVYPKNGKVHSEDEIIEIDSVNGIYPLTKLISESIVKTHCNDYLILRCSTLLGKYSRKNSLIKILENENSILTLSENSIFNYVLHSDVLDFIKFSIDNNLKGIFNLTSSENISLSEVVNLIGKEVKFGKYFYDSGTIDNTKVSSIFPVFRKSSKEVVLQFIQTWKR